MNNKRPLAPKFFNNLDKFLLLNNPSVWSTRTHLVLFYGLIFLVVLTLLAFMVPDDPRTDTQIPGWIGFVSVISFIGLIVYVIYLLRFNVFKRFGIHNPWSMLATFLLTFIAIGTFVFFPYVQPIVETVRANNQFTDEELARDINTMNLAITALEYDSVDHDWNRDTIRVIENYPSTDSNDDVEIRDIHPPMVTDTVTYINNPEEIKLVQQKDLQNELERADSVTRISDSTYILFYCPNYTPLNTYFPPSFNDSLLLSSLDIYNKLIRYYKRPDRGAELDKIRAVKNKYVVRLNEYHYYDTYSYEPRMKNRYAIYETGNSMRNIVDRMHRFDAENLPSLIRVHFYISLCLTLLLFSFRHSTPKSFFFGLLTAVILTIISSLFLAFSGGYDSNWLIWPLFYFALFFVISLYTFQSKSRSLVTGISINLFFWLLPFIPLVCVGAYYEGRDNRNIEVDYDRMQRDLESAEWIGIVIFLILLVTYSHRLYRRWYAGAQE